jgi:hypothetical protein
MAVWSIKPIRYPSREKGCIITAYLLVLAMGRAFIIDRLNLWSYPLFVKPLIK